ncbi:MAG: cyclodeaminase/cyclohydrolase family protein [Sporomusaceae bacterium]|nr:cyclodeaminase/cyclohydrolase family protein [Sporomusaceae bacterium]
MDYINLSVRDFARSLADFSTGPGGGSAAAVMGLLGISLLEMATGGETFAAHQQKITNGERMQLLPELRALHQWLLRLVDQDSAAFAAVLAAQEKMQTTPVEAELEEAVCGAIEVPLTIASSCLQALQLAEKVVSTIAAPLVSEVSGAAAALGAGIQGAAASAYANLPLLTSTEKRSIYETQILSLEASGKQLAEFLQKACFIRLHEK